LSQRLSVQTGAGRSATRQLRRARAVWSSVRHAPRRFHRAQRRSKRGPWWPPLPVSGPTPNPSGLARTLVAGGTVDRDEPFFQNLGTNGATRGSGTPRVSSIHRRSRTTSSRSSSHGLPRWRWQCGAAGDRDPVAFLKALW